MLRRVYLNYPNHSSYLKHCTSIWNYRYREATHFDRHFYRSGAPFASHRRITPSLTNLACCSSEISGTRYCETNHANRRIVLSATTKPPISHRRIILPAATKPLISHREPCFPTNKPLISHRELSKSYATPRTPPESGTEACDLVPPE